MQFNYSFIACPCNFHLNCINFNWKSFWSVVGNVENVSMNRLILGCGVNYSLLMNVGRILDCVRYETVGLHVEEGRKKENGKAYSFCHFDQLPCSPLHIRYR